MRPGEQTTLAEDSPPRLRRRLLPSAGILAMLLAFQGCDAGRVAAPPIAHADWTRLTGASIQDPFWPDWRGDSILFSGVTFNRFRNGLIRSDGSNDTLYAGVPTGHDLTPRWLADSVIVFASNRQGSYDIWYMSLSGAPAWRLTAFSGSNDEVGPAPRPGTPGLAYVDSAAIPALDGRIAFIPDTAQVGSRYLSPDTLRAGAPDWDPAGNRVCFSAESPDKTRHIWLVTIGASDTITRLTSGPFRDTDPRFSPDGRNIVFGSDRTGRPGVWVVSAAGEAAGLRLVSFDNAGRIVSTPAWSPDGHRIVVSSGGINAAQALYIITNTGF